MLRGFRDVPLYGKGQVFAAFFTGITPAAYTAVAQKALLYNGSGNAGGRGVSAWLLGVSAALTTASTVAGSLGIAIGWQDGSVPTSTTPVTLAGNLRPTSITPQAPACTALNAGTVTNAPVSYMPLASIGTGAITVQLADGPFVNLGGCIELPAGGYAAICGGEALTTSVFDLGLCWLEVPND